MREFAKLGLTRSVGGVLALALARELTPVVTAIILAGRVGSAFAAELGTMQVSDCVTVCEKQGVGWQMVGWPPCQVSKARQELRTDLAVLWVGGCCLCGCVPCCCFCCVSVLTQIIGGIR